MSFHTKGTIQGNGGGGSYTLPIASSTVLGGIKVGTGLSIDSVTGILSSTGGGSSPISVINTGTLISSGLPYSGLDSIANNSIFLGNSAGAYATNAEQSVFLGVNAGVGASDAFSSFFVGADAGNGASEAHNSIFLGEAAGNSAFNSSYSIFMGLAAGEGATDANNSNFFGQSTGEGANNASGSNFFGNTTGSNAYNAHDSNFMSYGAGINAENAHYSNFFGYLAGSNASNASNSIFIGKNSGSNDLVDNRFNNGSSILIGNNTNTGGYSNSIAIGGSAVNTASNQFMIGSSTRAINQMVLNGSSAYFNFGATGGTSGYGFRDNAGTMQFKNSGGSWANFGGGTMQDLQSVLNIGSNASISTGFGLTAPVFSFVGSTNYQDGLIIADDGSGIVRLGDYNGDSQGTNISIDDGSSTINLTAYTGGINTFGYALRINNPVDMVYLYGDVYGGESGLYSGNSDQRIAVSNGNLYNYGDDTLIINNNTRQTISRNDIISNLDAGVYQWNIIADGVEANISPYLQSKGSGGATLSSDPLGSVTSIIRALPGDLAATTQNGSTAATGWDLTPDSFAVIDELLPDQYLIYLSSNGDNELNTHVNAGHKLNLHAYNTTTASMDAYISLVAGSTTSMLFPQLAGSGTRYVTVDNTGKVSATAAAGLSRAQALALTLGA